MAIGDLHFCRWSKSYLFVVAAVLLYQIGCGTPLSMKWASGGIQTVEIMARYGEAFGGESTRAGSTYRFPDFQLTYLYFREPNSDERRKVEKINKADDSSTGVLLAPFSVFQIKTLENKEIGTFELSLIPYAWHEFSIGTELFRMDNMVPHTLKQWIVLNGVKPMEPLSPPPD